MSAHTPGPWGPHPYGDGRPRVVESGGEYPEFIAASVAIGSGSVLVAECKHYAPAGGYPSPTLSEMRANAALIMASPELLAVCEAALALLEDPDGDEAGANRVEAMLRGAISRAMEDVK